VKALSFSSQFSRTPLLHLRCLTSTLPTLEKMQPQLGNSPILNQLCEPCKQIQKAILVMKPEHGYAEWDALHHQSFRNFEKCVQEGSCHLCLIMSQDITYDRVGREEDSNVGTISLQTHKSRPNYNYLSVSYKFSKSGKDIYMQTTCHAIAASQLYMWSLLFKVHVVTIFQIRQTCHTLHH